MQPIEVVDRLRDKLVERAQHKREDPLAFISDRELFGDLVDDERFVTRVRAAALKSLHENGARATLEAI